jgi:hypothetical protein
VGNAAGPAADVTAAAEPQPHGAVWGGLWATSGGPAVGVVTRLSRNRTARFGRAVGNAAGPAADVTAAAAPQPQAAVCGGPRATPDGLAAGMMTGRG